MAAENRLPTIHHAQICRAAACNLIARPHFYLADASDDAVFVDEADMTRSDASRIITGDFSQLFVGIRSELRVEVLRAGFVAWRCR